MPTLNIGDSVKLNTPFNRDFSGTYTILALAEASDTYTVDIRNDGIGSDFEVMYLIKV